MNQLNQPNQTQLSVGFADPVHDAQQAFRCVLNALSRPGQRFSMGLPIKGLSLGAAMSHALLTLTDDDTAVWWQAPSSASENWLRFHTGAQRAATAQKAAFAVLLNAGALPLLNTFAIGTVEAPERAATLLIEVPSFESGPAVEWRGPGIQHIEVVRIAGLPDDFWLQWQANNASFPQGIDIIFTCADAVLGLPRTTRVRRLEGV